MYLTNRAAFINAQRKIFAPVRVLRGISLASAMNRVNISSTFDAGNIVPAKVDDPLNIDLRIRPDPFCESDNRSHFQWFYFRASGVTPGRTHTFTITNAAQASFASAWEGYQTCASFDGNYWFRVPTTYDAAKGLIIRHAIPEGAGSSVQYAYFAPYSYERHLQLIGRCQASPSVRYLSLGQTLDGREMDCLEVTDRGQGGAGGAATPVGSRRKIWVIARQHPGESMAEWLAEGLLERLLDAADPVARALLREAVVYVIPNMCPDGSVRGHLRTNAAGRNLNREWATPFVDSAPEVYYTLQKMSEVGVDMMLDIHGDEEIPANFVAGLDGIPSFDARLAKLQSMFKESLARVSPDFQTRLGYPTDRKGMANLKLCSKALGERFKCLSLTFEQPFKDTIDTPEPVQGWSPERAKRLGAAMVNTMHELAPHLRE